MAKAVLTRKPDVYELQGPCTWITYSTKSATAPPEFRYRDNQHNLNFKGDEIRIVETEIGGLVTVTLEVIPNAQTMRFTLLVPSVDLPPGSKEAPILTEGIRTIERTTPGPLGAAAEGGRQVQTYYTLTMQGTARSVAS